MSPRKRERLEGGGKEEAAAAAYIPIGIFEEILHRLSCSQLSGLRLVCKDWLRLISSRKFIEKHLERSMAASGCNETRILTLSHCGKINEYSYAGGNMNVMSKVKGKVTRIQGSCEFPKILGSCDGIVLFKVDYHKIALINPCTGTTETHDLPAEMLGDTDCSWFGHHPSTGEYVLVLVTMESIRLVFHVYSLSGHTINTFSIENLIDLNIDLCKSLQGIGTFLHGRIHFPVSCPITRDDRFIILGFEFESNEIFKMRAPSQLNFTLGVVEGCLSATIHRYDGTNEMWIMKEECCWSKYANIQGYNNRVHLTPIAYFPNGDVIFEGNIHDVVYPERKVSLYSLTDMETKQYWESYSAPYRGGCRAIVCVDSLVTPAMVWMGGSTNQEHTLTLQLDLSFMYSYHI